ncbi:hypothetical protein QBC43DRAFT_319179 [Cladorrhinum sp. PSN259]|nr:hypothetical protein QBC43DRAFT_319179 [Cladorrhinum sp. PSN259]
MPEPISATAGIGLALGILGFILTTLSSINARKHSILGFRFAIQTLSDSLRTCQLSLKSWDEDWNYPEYSQDIYQRLWREECANIHRQRQDVGRYVGELTDYLFGSFGIEHGSTGLRYPAGARKIFRVLRFALFSEATLTSKIDRVTKAMSNLQALSDKQLKTLRGQNPNTTSSGPQAGMLEKLKEMGQELFWNLRREKGTTGWALELGPRDRGMKAEEWWDWDVLRIAFSFRLQTAAIAPEHQRVILGYKLKGRTSPAQWAKSVLWPHQEGQEAVTSADQNPTVTSHEKFPDHKTTETFRGLFGRRFFEGVEPLVQIAWQSHQGDLVLSISNWAVLFWGSDWTTNLCCSSLRYTELKVDIRTCLHTLSPRQDHEPHGQQVQQATHQPWKPIGPRIPKKLVKQQRQKKRVYEKVQPDTGQQDGLIENSAERQEQGHQDRQQQGCQSVQAEPEFERCNHHSSKLVNFGLLLAEVICATPFRLSPADNIAYQKWTGSLWADIDRRSLLTEVHRQSMAAKFRKAVEFCLYQHDSATESDSALNFYLDFIDNVFVP